MAQLYILEASDLRPRLSSRRAKSSRYSIWCMYFCRQARQTELYTYTPITALYTYRYTPSLYCTHTGTLHHCIVHIPITGDCLRLKRLYIVHSLHISLYHSSFWLLACLVPSPPPCRFCCLYKCTCTTSDVKLGRAWEHAGCWQNVLTLSLSATPPGAAVDFLGIPGKSKGLHYTYTWMLEEGGFR